MPAGRPTNYRVEFCIDAHAMTQEGATDLEVAHAFGVNATTLYRWCAKYPELRKALQLGKEASDDRVERSLYHRAVGYSFEAVKIMQDKGIPVIVPYIEHVPPEPGAAMSWLKNRRGEKWRDRVEHEIGGELTIEIVRFAEVAK